MIAAHETPARRVTLLVIGFLHLNCLRELSQPCCRGNFAGRYHKLDRGLGSQEYDGAVGNCAAPSGTKWSVGRHERSEL